MINPHIKFSYVDNSLYSKLEGLEEKSYKKFISEEEQQTPNNIGSSERDSRDGKSYRIIPSSSPQITTRKNITAKYDQINMKQEGKYERDNDE